MKLLIRIKLALIFMAAPLLAMSDTVIVYTWANYLTDGVVAEFEKKTGHRIQQVYFDSKAGRDRVLLSIERSAYDLILFDANSLAFFGAYDLLKPVSDYGSIGLAHHAEEYRESCGNWGVPFARGTLGIAYRSSFVQEPVSSWSDLFHPPASLSGHLVMPLDDADTASVVMLALGEELDTNSSEAFNAALHLLKMQIPHLLKYGSGLTYANIQGNQSDMRMTLVYNRELAAIEQYTKHSDWTYVVPEEGSVSWVDCWATMNGKILKPAAAEFLAYLNQPSVAARNAETSGYATTNESALEYVSQAYLENKTLFPSSHGPECSAAKPELNARRLSKRSWLIMWAKTQYSEFLDRTGG